MTTADLRPHVFRPDRLKAAREKAGMTQEALADRVTEIIRTRRCRARNLVRWEKPHGAPGSHTPRPEFIAAFAQALGEPISYFFGTETESGDEEGGDDSDEESSLRRVAAELILRGHDDLAETLMGQIQRVKAERTVDA